MPLFSFSAQGVHEGVDPGPALSHRQTCEALNRLLHLIQDEVATWSDEEETAS